MILCGYIRKLLSLVPLKRVSMSPIAKTRGDFTYMLNNTPCLPPKPVHDVPERALVVDPAHVALEVRSQERQLLVAPDRPQNVQGIREAVVGQGVVVLLKVSYQPNSPIPPHPTHASAKWATRAPSHRVEQ